MLRHAIPASLWAMFVIAAFLLTTWVIPTGDASPLPTPEPGSGAGAAPAWISAGTIQALAGHGAHTGPAAPGPEARMAFAPRPATPGPLAPASSIFSTPVQVSTTTTTVQNGGPVFAYNTNPSTVSDASGYIWTAWSANVSGRWSIFFSYSSDGGAAFSSPVKLDPSSSDQDTSPSLAVYGSGSTADIAVVWENRSGYYLNQAASDGYILDVSLNGGSTWTQHTNFAVFDNGAAYGKLADDEGAVATWTSSGDVLVTYWSYWANCGTYVAWPTCTVVIVDGWTGGTTYCTAATCDGAFVFEGPRAASTYYAPYLASACSTSATDCGFLLDYSVSGNANWLLQDMYSTGNFISSGTGTPLYGPMHIATATFGSPYYAVLFPDQGSLAYGAGNTSVAAVEYNVGSLTAPTYDVYYYYDSATTWVRGGYPTGSSTTTGVYSAVIAIDPANDGPVISWVDSSYNIDATWTSSPTGTFLAVQTVVAGGALSATSVGITTATSPAPFRIDIVYIDSGNPNSQTYYSGFLGLYATASASPTTTDLWHNVQFSATPNGGAPSFTFSWSFGGACSPSCPTTTQNPSVNYTSSGSYAVSVTVTDSIGESATASVGTIKVNPRLLCAISPGSATVDQNTPVTFTATPSGGSGSYGANAYAWQINGVTQSGSTASSFTTTFTSTGTEIVAVDVMDSLGFTSPWTGSTVTVNLPLKVGTLNVTPAVAAVGQQVNFTASVTGGTMPYAYAWYLGFGSTSNVAAPSKTYSQAGNYTVYLNVTDAALPAGSAGVTGIVRIDTPMTIWATEWPTNPATGQTVYFNATASGGSGKYSFQWIAGDGSSTITGQNAQHIYAASGSFTVWLWVNDTIGLSKSLSLPITVVAPLTVVSATPSPNPTNTTTMVTMNALATGGVLPYTYSWNFGDGSPSALGQYVHHNYTTANTNGYTVTVTVTDSAKHTATQSFSEIVNAAGSSGSGIAVDLVASPDPANVNFQTSFTASASGGSGAYVTYVWNFGDGSNPVTTSTRTTTYTYTAVGTYSVTVTVTDSQGHTGKGTLSLQVVNSGSFLAQVLANPSTADVGESVFLNASVAGGSGTYSSYAFDFGDGTSQVVPATGPTASTTHAYTTLGTYQVTVTVTDSLGDSVKSAATTVVIDAPLSVSVSSARPSADPGQAAQFTATPTGGSGNYGTVVYWNFGAGSATTDGAYQQTAAFSNSQPQAITEAVTATVTDTVTGAWASFTLSFTVNPPLTIAITSSNNNLPAPMTVTLTANVKGGIGPYSMVWAFGDGSTPITTSSDSVQHTFNTSGPFEVTVLLTDGDSSTVTGYFNATVASPGGSGGFGSVLSSSWFWLVLVIVVVAAVLLVVLTRRRKPRTQDTGVPVGGGGGVLVGGGAVVAAGTSAAPDLMAPPVPAGSSDHSPDDFGGVLPATPSGTAPSVAAAVALAPGSATAMAPGSVPTLGPACPRCGAALMGRGVPCPNCNYLPAAGELAAGTSAAGPASRPPVGELTHCPQCQGPLTPDRMCANCQVRWEPSMAEPTSGIGHPTPGPAPGAGGPAPSAELTHCPQCGNPLSSGRACNVCQVIWEPTGAAPSATGEGAPAGPPTSVPLHVPSVVEVPRPTSRPPATATPAPADPRVTTIHFPEAAPEIVAPTPSAPVAPSPPPPSPDAAPPLPPATVPAKPAPGPSASLPAPPNVVPEVPTPSAAPEEPRAPPMHRCFICDGPLEQGYCSNCNMSWADEGSG